MIDKIKEFVIKFWEANKDKLFESLKAAGRYLLFAWLSTTVSYLLTQPNLTPILFAALTAADKWIYENWKENDKTGLRGISPI